MNTETANTIVSKITTRERFYGTKPPVPGLIDVEDLRTEKTRGKMPLTMRFGFNFTGREDYVAWVKAWKEAMNELTRLVRVQRSAYRATRKRNGLAPEAQAQAEALFARSWDAYQEAVNVLRKAFVSLPGDHKELARELLSLRKAAKIAAAQQRAANLTAKAA